MFPGWPFFWNISFRKVNFFLSRLSFTDTDDSQDSKGQQGKGGDHLISLSITFTLSRTLIHLFATLYVRWLSRIFNRNACVYQTASRWDLPPYQITIWLIDWWWNVCLLTWWIDSRLFVTAIWHGKPVVLNSYRLSHLYYKRTD